MRWAWDNGADSKVADLWMFRERLQHSREIAYLKLFQGRATFTSLEFLEHLIAARRLRPQRLSTTAQSLLDALCDTSPQSTKELKKSVGLKGKIFEANYHKALKELWTRGLIVGRGERDDGAFPSLLIAATELVFEDVFKGALKRDPLKSHQECLRCLAGHPEFLRFFLALQKPIV
jgi:predicted transcriptional regulator